MPLRRRPDTPISAESSFSSPSLSRHPPPASPPLSSAVASREPVTPPEEQEDEEEEEEPEDPPSTTPTELSAFFASITAFLERDYLDEKTLTLTEVSPARLAKFQRWALNRRLHRLRYTYDAATGTLHLRGMITTVHSAINPWLTEIYSKIPLSDEERSHIILDTSYDIQLRGGVIWQPDAAFNYIFFDEEEGEEVTDLYPRVIFEVAFAQKHAAVKRRAEGWLKGAKGMVKVVVAVNIEEGRRPGAVGDSGAADRDDSRGENQEGDSVGSETESDDFTSEQAIADFYKSCKTSDLVGPLTATVELFRLGKDGDMERDGPVYRFLPDRSPDADPVLRISDLLRDTRDDDQRTVTLPLQRYGQLINTAKRRLALIRKTRQKKSKRKRVEEEGEEGEDYVTVEVPERQVKRGRLLRSGSGIIGGEGPSGDVRG